MTDAMQLMLTDTRLVPALDIAARATALLALAWAVHAIAGRRRALLRSTLWNACLFGLLIVPVACVAFPRLPLPILPMRANVTVRPEVMPQTGSKPGSGAFETRNDPKPERATMSLSLDAIAFSSFEDGHAQAAALGTVPMVEHRRKWRPDFLRIGLGLYLAVASALLIRLGFSMLAVRRLRQDCIPVSEPAWANGLARAAARLQIKRPVRLSQSDRISVPVVAGWPQPLIVLPAALAGSADRDLIDAVLLHELAHVRRGDFIWNVVRRLVQAVYWPHPLVWPMGRAISAVREQACDDLCVHVLGGPEGYHDSLVEVAAGLVRRPDPALGMALARPTALARRIAWIHRTPGAADCILPRPTRLAVAVSVVSLAGLIGSVKLARTAADPVQPAQELKIAKATEKKQAEPDPKQNRQPNREVPKSIEITVLAEPTGKPLANASISAYVDRKMEFLRTDKDGRVRIELAGRAFLDVMSVDIFAEGYVQQRFAYSKYESDNPPIPADLTVRLWPGDETLGGKVVDEQGQPVAGAKVEIWGYLGEKKDPHELAYMVDARTDAEGQWRCRSFRKMTWAHLYLSHPDFVADTDKTPRMHGRIRPDSEPGPDEQPFQALRDFTDVEVMKKGIRITGRAVDEASNPVVGAEVGWIRVEARYSLQLDVQKATTDADGRFALPQARPGQIVLQFKAPGHATDTKIVTAKEGMEPLAITIGRPHVMMGRVVDTKGAPIPGCDVLVDPWRDYGGPGFYLKTDANGRFRWDEAPAEGLLIRVGSAGFETVDRLRLNPAEGETVVTLKRALNVKGTIRDAETGQKIDRSAEIEVGTPDAVTGAIAWNPGSKYVFAGGEIRVTVRDGQLRASLDAEAFPQYRLRVRAKGYLPFETRDFRSDEGQVAYDIRLGKADEPQGVVVSGVVRRPDGKPLAGADVAVAYDQAGQNTIRGVHVFDGVMRRTVDQVIVKTDTEGRFSLTRDPDPAGQPFALIVVHPDFYAEVQGREFEAARVIVARPWARIEGVARVGKRPASGAVVMWHGDRRDGPLVPAVFASGRTETDAKGRFVIERAVPGDVQVMRREDESPRASRGIATALVRLKPGETGRVELGGKGRPVVARVELPAGFDLRGDYAANSELRIVSDRPMIPYPKGSRRRSDAAEWAQRWWNSPEGFEYRSEWFAFVRDNLSPDGTIRVEDVPPGDYRLQLTWSGEPVRGRDIEPRNVGYVTLKFTVPEIQGGQTDEPLDLGTLKPVPKPVLKTGEAVPQFDVETLDGKRLKLADLHGKFVLLDFWATWCGPCIAEIPEMKSVFDRHRNDARFAMVSLSLDADQEAPRQFLAGKGLGWHQGWLGEKANGGIQQAYGVESIPAAFLIGPDGKLVAKGLRGREIGAAVARELDGRRK